MLVDQGAQWDAGGDEEQEDILRYSFCFPTVSVESV